MVLGPTETIRIEVIDDRPATLTVDGEELGALERGDAIVCRAAPQVAKPVHHAESNPLLAELRQTEAASDSARFLPEIDAGFDVESYDLKGLIDWELWCVDGASVRASRAAAGADKKVSRATPTSRRTTHWAAREAGLDRSSMWSLTVRELRLPLK